MHCYLPKIMCTNFLTSHWLTFFCPQLPNHKQKPTIMSPQGAREILGPVYDNEKENWRILTNKEIYASVKKTYYNRDNKVK